MTQTIVTKQIGVGGLTFDVDVAGPTDGPVVLLLHGFPQTRWSWRRQLPELAAAGFYCLAPSQRGYSPGARPLGSDAYVATHMVDDALGLMDQVGAERFHLVGHDWGGQIAWLLAARAPERLLSLSILSRPHPAAFMRALAEDPDQPQRSGHHASLLDPARPAAIRDNNMAVFKAMFARQGVGEVDADAYCAALQPAGALEAAIEWYRASAKWLRVAGFPPIATRTLYLWGDADSSVGRMAAGGTAEFITGPYRFVEIAGAGHFLTDQVPEVVNEALLAHLQSR